MNLSCCVLRDATPDCILEGSIKGNTMVTSTSVEYQVERCGSVAMIPFLPIPQRISPKTPKFWGARRDLEPVVANEEEAVRVPS